jgi:addiction module HigA family antidote
MPADVRNLGLPAAAAGDLTPGEHLRAEIERLELDQVAVAHATGVSRQSINNIINGRQPISRAMAGKLGRLTGHSSDYWLRATFPRSGGASTEQPHPPATVAAPMGVLVNHQIDHAVKAGLIGLDPYIETNLQPASIDLTLDDFVITTDGDTVDISGGQGFTLKPQQTVNVCTRETVEFPLGFVGRVGAMTELAKIGIITSHGFQVDPGFKGSLQFCVFNAGGRDFELRSGEPIISLEITQLGALPAPDARIEKHLSEATDRENVVKLFAADESSRALREAVRAAAAVELTPNGAEARIPALNIALEADSADAALDAAVHSAFTGLRALRDNADAALEQRDAYTHFFATVAENVQFDAKQTRHVLARLGLAVNGAEAAVLSLRDGKPALLRLPPPPARLRLNQLARQLREDPLDLILLLAGLTTYRNAENA